MKKMTTRSIVIIALFVAIMAVLSQIALPLGEIPFSVERAYRHSTTHSLGYAQHIWNCTAVLKSKELTCASEACLYLVIN